MSKAGLSSDDLATVARGPSRRPLRRALRWIAAWPLRFLLRVRIEGVGNFHAAGERVLIVANHVSLLDGALLYLFLPEAPIFAVNRDTAQRWYLKPFLALAERRELDPLNPVSIKSMVRMLRMGHKAAVFPEARVSNTGSLMKIYEGPGLIADKADAVILPVGIDGPQFSKFSSLRGRLPRRWLPPVTIKILAPQKLELPDELKGAARRAAATRRLTRIMREISFDNAFHDETLFAFLVRASRRHGRGATVIEDSTGASLSFGQLIARSFILGGIIARETAPTERVGIMLPSTAAGIVSFFACQACGRQAAMLNFTAGPRGLITAIETADIKLVLTSRSFITAGALLAEAEALESATTIIFLEDLRGQISILRKLSGLLAARLPLLAHGLLARRKTSADPAVVLFTSGSEGIPKGVVLSHANLVANYAQTQMLIDLTHRDRVLNVLPIFHAFGLLGGVLLPLFEGARSYQYPSPLHYRIIPELCYELGITCLFGTTTFLRGYGRNAHPYDFHALRYVIAGAEKLTEETRQLWFDKFGIRIFEGYGATEASPVIAVNNPQASRDGTVGLLLAHMEHTLQPVDGITDGGGLVVRGPNIMLGYLYHGGEGEIIQPWTELGAGWYDTGDIVSIDDEGFVAIQGRAKRFAKIGGEMVSLAAVEDLALGLWPDGQHAAIAMPDRAKGEQIILFSNVAEATRADLVTAAGAGGASDLTIPKRVSFEQEIPQLGSGKVDYLALKALVANQTRTG